MHHIYLNRFISHSCSWHVASNTHRLYLRLKSFVGGALLIICLTISGCSFIYDTPYDAPSTTPELPQPTPSSAKPGLHLLLSDAHHDWPPAVWPNHLTVARQFVGEGGYVVELVRLDDLEVAHWQVFMDLCRDLQLTPILRLATTAPPAGGWLAPPADEDGRYRLVAAQYTTFINSLTWPTTPMIIVGNEPNHGSEWGGRPDPAAYARFLSDVAQALHQANPHIQVLNAGFDPYTPHTGEQPFLNGQYYLDEETFLDEMVAAQPDVFSHIDIWASHSYPQGPFTEPPWVQSYGVDWLNGATNPRHLEPPQNLYNRGINGYAWELFKLASYGVEPLPVLITETGWRHAETTDPTSPDNGRPLPNAETVALYMDLALQGNQNRYPDLPQTGWTPWLTDERVIGIVFFAFDGNPTFWGHTNWVILNDQGQITDTYFENKHINNILKSDHSVCFLNRLLYNRANNILLNQPLQRRYINEETNPHLMLFNRLNGQRSSCTTCPGRGPGLCRSG